MVLIALSLLSAPAFADECTLEIEGNDQMQFNKSEMEAPLKCGTVTIKLIHTGKLPKNAMGHNWVLVETKNVMAIGSAGMKAGLDNDHVPPKDDRVFAASKVIGGGEETTVEVDLTKLDKSLDYSFVCTFPGHFSMMKGKFKLA